MRGTSERRKERRRVLGDRLHELRSVRRLSQEEVADLAGISRNTYNRAENGKANLTFDSMWAVADVFEVDVTELLKGHHRSPGNP